jgi:hypothetical protein
MVQKWLLFSWKKGGMGEKYRNFFLNYHYVANYVLGILSIKEVGFEVGFLFSSLLPHPKI